MIKQGSLPKGRKKAGAIFLYLVLAAITVLMFVPTLWGLCASFKPEEEVLAEGIHFLPKDFTFENYLEVFTNRNNPVLRWFFNSLVIAVLNVVLYLFIASMAAFAFSRLKFKGRETLFVICMMSMMIPGIINVIPNYVIIEKLGLLDNYLAMVLPGLGGVGSVFMIRQFMKGIPKEYDEAARIDGASSWCIYTRVILPLCKPALITAGIFAFQGSWNDFLWPLIVTNRPETRTLTSGLYIMQGLYSHQYGKLLAGAMLSALPVLIVFLFGQKYLVEGINVGGIKG